MHNEKPGVAGAAQQQEEASRSYRRVATHRWLVQITPNRGTRPEDLRLPAPRLAGTARPSRLRGFHACGQNRDVGASTRSAAGR